MVCRISCSHTFCRKCLQKHLTAVLESERKKLASYLHATSNTHLIDLPLPRSLNDFYAHEQDYKDLQWTVDPEYSCPHCRTPVLLSSANFIEMRHTRLLIDLFAKYVSKTVDILQSSERMDAADANNAPGGMEIIPGILRADFDAITAEDDGDSDQEWDIIHFLVEESQTYGDRWTSL